MVTEELEHKVEDDYSLRQPLYLPGLLGFLEERLGKKVMVKRVPNSFLDNWASIGEQKIFRYGISAEGGAFLGTVWLKEDREESYGYNPVPYRYDARVKIPTENGRILPWPFQRKVHLSYVADYSSQEEFVEERKDKKLEIPFP